MFFLSYSMYFSMKNPNLKSVLVARPYFLNYKNVLDKHEIQVINRFGLVTQKLGASDQNELQIRILHRKIHRIKEKTSFFI